MAARKAILSPPIGKISAPRDIAARLARRGTAGAELGRSGPVGTGTQRAHAADTHKFLAGQTVTLMPNRYGANRHGRFEVIRALPEEHGVHYYRLKSIADGHERVVGEDELT